MDYLPYRKKLCKIYSQNINTPVYPVYSLSSGRKLIGSTKRNIQQTC